MPRIMHKLGLKPNLRLRFGHSAMSRLMLPNVSSRKLAGHRANHSSANFDKMKTSLENDQTSNTVVIWIRRDEILTKEIAKDPKNKLFASCNPQANFIKMPSSSR